MCACVLMRLKLLELAGCILESVGYRVLLTPSQAVFSMIVHCSLISYVSWHCIQEMDSLKAFFPAVFLLTVRFLYLLLVPYRGYHIFLNDILCHGYVFCLKLFSRNK